MRLLTRTERRSLNREEKRALRVQRRPVRKAARQARQEERRDDDKINTAGEVFGLILSLVGGNIDRQSVADWAREQAQEMLEDLAGFEDAEEPTRDDVLDELAEELAANIDQFVNFPEIFGPFGALLDQLDDPGWRAFARFILRPLIDEVYPETPPAAA